MTSSVICRARLALIELPLESVALATTFIVVVAIGVAVEVEVLLYPPPQAPEKTISPNATNARLGPRPDTGSVAGMQ